MKLSLIAARSQNGIIGNGPDIPWRARGEQLLFKALTFNQWLLVGRKTFSSMGVLPDRKYAVVSRSVDFVSESQNEAKNVLCFESIETALTKLQEITDHVIVAGGGQLYASLIDKVDVLHLSTIHTQAEGDVFFPEVPKTFRKVFSQNFSSNIDYSYEVFVKEA